MSFDVATITAIAAAHANHDPRELVALAIREYSPNLGISFSGAEDVVLIDMAAKAGGSFRVFSLDTGALLAGTRYRARTNETAHLLGGSY